MSASVAKFIRANVVGFVALFVALSAGAYAANLAPKNSVVSKSIKNRQVKKADLATGSVTAKSVAANSLAGAGINESGLDAGVLQRRVTGNCPSGQAIRQVGEDGNVTCEGVGGGGGGTVTQVNTGFGLSGGPITTSGTITVDDSAVQRRVTGSCTGSQAIQSVNSGGGVSCGGQEIKRIHQLVPSSNGDFGASTVLTIGHLEVLGLCHAQLLDGSTVVSGTKLLFYNQGSNTDTLNWFYSDGTNVSAGGQTVTTTGRGNSASKPNASRGSSSTRNTRPRISP